MNRRDDTSTGLPASVAPLTTGGIDLVTAAGVDHVRLVYDYLDNGDLDSCASLLHDGVVLELPGAPVVQGRTAVPHAHLGSGPPGARHEIDRIVAQGRSVVATGSRIATGTGGEEVRFVDLFTIADDGLLLTCTRYFHVAP
ncbi:nuclear transport factor 2 family protein [Streptomyces sp. NPDC058877]|uniref:nuclear transport factor 2 family protein n=1 Tax=unclassified Streptomyces TaxID=2593676 RepID=UPI00367D2CC0